MSGTTLLIHLAGAIALLLWGSHMISTALQRGFGTPLRNWMGRHLTNRWTALLSGIGITGILQSSTAVSMMATSFTAAGTLSLAPALAVMLGANIGSTLVVQLMSFNMEIAIPLLLLAGFVVFKLRDHSSFESVGCALIGLGLMLLALHLLGGTLQDIEVTPVFHAVMQGATGRYFHCPAGGGAPDAPVPLQRGDDFADRLSRRYRHADPGYGPGAGAWRQHRRRVTAGVKRRVRGGPPPAGWQPDGPPVRLRAGVTASAVADGDRP